MRVFLSWSGHSSRMAAEALRDWLPNVLQTLEPWLSAEDIPLGARWYSEISSRLEASAAGIICLTRENAGATWVNYEVGALARSNVLVCPYLLDLEPAELAGPLSQFQSAKADRNGTFSLVRTLNGKNEDLTVSDSILNRAFEVYWPTLEARLSEIRRTLPTGLVPRSVDERIEEILVLLRQLVERRVVPDPVGKTAKEATPATTKPRVFIGSSSEGLRVAELIQLGLQQSAECTLWTQGAFALSRTVIESIVDLTVQFDFAVLVLTPDDFVVKRGAEASGPRDNVVFELGLFTGALGRARTFMVFPRDAKLHLPSDLAGVTAVTYEKRSDGNLEAALGPVCTRIKQAMGVF